MIGYHNLMTLYTESNVIYSGSAAATITLTHQPPDSGSFLKVDVRGGTSNTGNVIINGTETIEFTGADWKISESSYSPTMVITTTGLADEATIPTITITSVDMAGNPINWSTSESYPCEFRKENTSSYADAMLLREGLTSQSIYIIRLDNEITINTGQEFTIEGLTQRFVVWSEPNYHFQLETDYIDYIEFKAIIKR